ncbi:hypothetical protein ABL78_3251 [Leptomonas seymouri]|uniref:Uncharacterized protein n=1 Tax=Leptomonas seymouri TaxID=5684 RepID=A0A0N1IL42_LEPSE|nr:hypothetical protein ABL78_3251 [Leptomonas seymouri]|eukprot:KPI87653.1 hypothetical protein ABL78_3251 [Leptomonas seymouri]
MNVLRAPSSKLTSGMPHCPSNSCGPVFCADSASQHGAAGSTTHTPRKNACPPTDEAAAALHSAILPSIAAHTIAAFAEHVVTHNQAVVRRNSCAHPDHIAEHNSQHLSTIKEDIETHDSKSTLNGLAHFPNEVEAAIAKASAAASVCPAAIGGWSPLCVQHVPNANTVKTHLQSMKNGSSTMSVDTTTAPVPCPSIWICQSTTQAEEGLTIAPPSFISGAACAARGNKRSDEGCDTVSLSSPTRGTSLLAPQPVEDAGAERPGHDLRSVREAAAASRAADWRLSPLTGNAPTMLAAANDHCPRWAGVGWWMEPSGGADVAVTAAKVSTQVTGSPSPRLPVDSGEQASLAHSLQLPAPETVARTTKVEVMAMTGRQMSSVASFNRCTDGTLSPSYGRRSSCCSCLSPGSELMQPLAKWTAANSILHNVAGAVEDEDWESKRVCQTSAKRRSCDSSLMCSNDSVASLSITVHSPLFEVRSDSVSGRDDTHEDIDNKKAKMMASTDAPVPYRVPFSLTTSVSMATPPALLPRTFSAPQFCPDELLYRHTRRFASNGAGVAADRQVCHFHDKSSIPSMTTEDKQRWYVPLSMY